MKPLPEHLREKLSVAVNAFWATRQQQLRAGTQDQGNRKAVTAGKQLDGFLELLKAVAIASGVPSGWLYSGSHALPGYFRPAKAWDFLIVSPENKLLVAIELKSQVGSFGNNFNNRTEEAIGSAVDLWTAFRENTFPAQNSPWVGYLMVVERSERSIKPVRLPASQFGILPAFKNTNYLERYALFCERLIQERHYSAAGLLWTTPEGEFGFIAEHISVETFIYQLIGYLRGEMERYG